MFKQLLFVPLLFASQASAGNLAGLDLGACNDFSAMAGTAATCDGASTCDITCDYIGTSPGTSIDGPFRADEAWQIDNDNSKACALDGLAAWNEGMERGALGAAMRKLLGHEAQTSVVLFVC
jgi:hypothetical protein